MSQANAAARKRRGVPPSTPIITPNVSQQTQPQKQNSYTLPQVISIIDNRLTSLEKNMNNSSTANTSNNSTDNTIQTAINDEFNERFNIIALEMNYMKNMISKQDDEIQKLKTTLMSVQTSLLQMSTSQKVSENVIEDL